MLIRANNTLWAGSKLYDWAVARYPHRTVVLSESPWNEYAISWLRRDGRERSWYPTTGGIFHSGYDGGDPVFFTRWVPKVTVDGL